jgi:hypothetical protein
MKIELSKNQKKIAECKKKFILAVCGRRFGKEVADAKMALDYLLKEKSVVGWVCPTKDMLSLIAYKTFLSLCPADEIKSKNKKEGEIQFNNGSCLYFVNGNVPTSVRGLCPDFLILDESSYMKYEVWKNVEPMFEAEKFHCLIISTPNGKKNWLYDIYKTKRKDKEWVVFRFASKQGGFVDKQALKTAKAQMSKKLFAQEFLAKFVSL